MQDPFIQCPTARRVERRGLPILSSQLSAFKAQGLRVPRFRGLGVQRLGRETSELPTGSNRRLANSPTPRFAPTANCQLALGPIPQFLNSSIPQFPHHIITPVAHRPIFRGESDEGRGSTVRPPLQSVRAPYHGPRPWNLFSVAVVSRQPKRNLRSVLSPVSHVARTIP
jgi:hypothetical protein